MRSSRTSKAFRELPGGVRQQLKKLELASEQPAEGSSRMGRSLTVIAGGYEMPDASVSVTRAY